MTNTNTTDFEAFARTRRPQVSARERAELEAQRPESLPFERFEGLSEQMRRALARADVRTCAIQREERS